MNQKEVVEWAPFHLAPGVKEEQLLEASRHLQDSFLAKQPGFLRRDLLRGEAGGWVDIVWWVDRAAAEAAVKVAADSSVCHSYFQLMSGADHANPGDAVHFDRVVSYP